MGSCIDLKFLYWAASSIVLVIIPHSKAGGDDTVMNYLTKYITQNVSVQKVNLLCESSEESTSLATEFALHLGVDLSLEISDLELWWRPKNASIENLSLTTLMARVSERHNLAMGIIDIRNGVDVFKKLKSQLTLFKQVSAGQYRCRCLLILINHEWDEFEKFLFYAWSWKFLDLTIIELIRSSPIGPPSLASKPHEDDTAVVHMYNPFFEKYTKNLLTADTDLFPKKTKDLNGYPLRVRAHTYKELSYKIKNPPELNTGHDHQLLLAVADRLNVTAYLYCHIYGCTEDDLSIGAEEEIGRPFDIGSDPDDRRNVYYHSTWDHRNLYYGPSFIHLPTLISFNFLFKGLIEESQFELSKEGLLACGALLLTGVFFASYARVLGFKVKNWSIINITTAQMGGSLENRGPMSERIYLITMYVTTFIVTTIATDYILEMFTYRKEVNNFKTLEELADSNIPIVMSARDFNFLRHEEGDPILEKILNRSERVELSDGYGGFCGLNVMYDKVDDSINLCFVGARDNVPVLKLRGNWYVDRIEEPIQMSIPILVVLGQFYLVNDINLIVVRFKETGFLEYWAKQEQRDLISHTIERGGDPSLLTESLPADQPETEEAAPLKYQLRAIMVIGSSLSFIALICEIIWSRFLSKTEIGRFMRAFNRYSCDLLVLCGREPNKMSRSS
ncbi:hypothetical protein QAD02_016910 [Eretmocerus hayati]|uniref:Uncharacterized protein n=1 Tax=Eretmocerus hayati TaxID=131215 RepID=A0ACC2PDE8_9HYME|nr:hypothetical protein QAD02_016910 [Eretmocerus hayati]